MEMQVALDAAIRMCAAARTAPKAKSVDRIKTMTLTGEDKDKLAAELRRLGEEKKLDFYLRDAGNLDAAQAVALIGTTQGYRGLGEACGLCHFNGCEACEKAGACCVFDSMDLGIALGSAVATAADMRVDTRIMYSVGQAAVSLGLLGEDVKMIMAVPVSVSGKSPFFDRKKKA